MKPSDRAPATASRVARLKAESAYQVLARAQYLESQGADIIHLEIGEPDFPTPDAISDAGVAAIRAGRTRYNPTPGLPELRAAIAEDAGRRRGTTIRPTQVVVGPGAKPLLFLPTLAIVQPGDEVIYPDPGFPTYEAMIEVAGGIPVPVPLVEENNFSLDLDAVDQRRSRRTRLIVLNSPSNPTGGVIPHADLEHIAELACRHDCWVLSDEVYSRIAYDGCSVPSIASLDRMMERTILVDGFSKTYSMTGWRLGFGVMPEPLAEKVALLLVHAAGCTAHFTQYAGLEALAGSQEAVSEMVAAYQVRRNRLVAGLNEIPGVTCRLPQGAFYAFPNVKALGRPSEEIAELLLEEAGVAALPGTAFGAFGQGYLRLCYANSLAHIEQALQRMRVALSPLAGR